MLFTSPSASHNCFLLATTSHMLHSRELANICLHSIPFAARHPLASTAGAEHLFPTDQGRFLLATTSRTLHGLGLTNIRHPPSPSPPVTCLPQQKASSICFLLPLFPTGRGHFLFATTHRTLHSWGLTDIRLPSIPFAARSPLASTTSVEHLFPASSVSRWSRSLLVHHHPPHAARLGARRYHLFPGVGSSVYLIWLVGFRSIFNFFFLVEQTVVSHLENVHEQIDMAISTAWKESKPL